MKSNTGKPMLSVVVWEYENKQGRWRPYSPEVTQHLERAYAKKLRSVMLGDAEPYLSDYYLNLSSFQQINKMTGLATNVRRSLYPQSSPAGQGAVWEWAGDEAGVWHKYDMFVQCILEDSWTSGSQIVDLVEKIQNCPYSINFCALNQKNTKTGATRAIRRKTQATYPIGRPTIHQSDTVYGAKPLLSSLLEERGKMRKAAAKEDSEAKGSNKGLLNKMSDFLHLPSRGGSSCSDLTAPSTSKTRKSLSPKANLGFVAQNPSEGHFTRSKKTLAASNSRIVPPIPKPRTLLPSQQTQQGSETSKRMDSVDEQFVSLATLNSDLGSLHVRRPSIETISTYLSQESFNDDYNTQLQISHNLHDSLGENDVFAVDPEVMEFMNNDTPTRDTVNHTKSSSHFLPINCPSQELDREAIKCGRKRTLAFSPGASCRDNDIIYKRYFSKRPARTDKEKLLVQFTVPGNESTGDCSICLCPLNDESSYEEASAGILVSPVVSLANCRHSFHEECIFNMVESTSATCIRCPNCQTFYGRKTGTQPPGTMRTTRHHSSLPGHPGCGTIKISYLIHSGTQGPEHPNPGKPYHATAFPRVGYLPDSDKGRKVLRLLEEAFNRRLIFTIGTSTTTGMNDVVTWNEIHHKTSVSNEFGHGYPDPAYLDNILAELAAQGVISP